MLKKKKRLTKGYFGSALKGKRFYGESLDCVFSREGTGRATVVVSKKVCPHAVGRNKIKRHIYNTIKKNIPDCGTFVFLVKSVDQKAVENMEDEIKSLINRSIAWNLGSYNEEQ